MIRNLEVFLSIFKKFLPLSILIINELAYGNMSSHGNFKPSKPLDLYKITPRLEIFNPYESTLTPPGMMNHYENSRPRSRFDLYQWEEQELARYIANLPDVVEPERNITPLSAALKNGHNYIAKMLIIHGANINNVGKDGISPLMAAVDGNCSIDMIQFLLDKGANVNYSYKGSTAISQAIEIGRTDIVELLLENGADPNIQGDFVQPPLIMAAGRGQNEIVQALLEHHADPNIKNRDRSDETALTIAAERGHNKIVQALLENGANPDIKNKLTNTALIIAAQRGHNKIVQALLEHHADPNIKNYYNETALIIAANLRYSEIVQVLLENGANPDIKNKLNETALIVAAQRDDSEIVQVLLKHHADPNIINEFGQTAIMYAATSKSRNSVEALLKHGADPNTKDRHNRTALFNAAQFGRSEIVQVLLKHHADPNIKNCDNETALIVAAQRGCSEIVQALLEHHADPNIGNSHSKPLIQWVHENGKSDIFQMLAKYIILQKFEDIKKEQQARQFFIKEQDFINFLNKYREYLDKTYTDNAFKELETIKIEKRNAFQEKKTIELANSVAINQSPVDPKTMSKIKDTCASCFTHGMVYPICPAENNNCSSKLCEDCTQLQLNQLIINVKTGDPSSIQNHEIVCNHCKRRINLQYYKQIPSCKQNGNHLEEEAIRLKLLLHPLWKFCPRGCLNGNYFEKDEKHFNCEICGFNGCIICNKEHKAGDPCNAAELQEALLQKALELGAKKKPYPIYSQRLNPFQEHQHLMSLIYIKRDENNPTKNGLRKYGDLNEREYLEQLTETEYNDAVYQHRDQIQFGTMSKDDYLLLGTYRPCPKCGIMIEKGPACWHMTCKCNADFNWDSGLEHPTSTTQDYQGVRKYNLKEGVKGHF